MPPDALRAVGISKSYGELVAVSDLSFEVPQGCIYGILGPNGAGKSTMLRMLNDIIAPDRGEIVLLGSLRPGLDAARRIGYLPEERGLYPKMRIGETLEFFGELRGLDRAEARRRAGLWLERLGLSEWTKKNVQDLSKGMQQKVQFASALIHEPELLILDEPWSGLDPLNAEVLREIVLEQRSAGRTILFSTHLMEQAEKICDRVCIIAHGKKVLEGELGAIKRAAAPIGLLALALTDPGDRDKASGLLRDRALVAAVRERGDHLEIQLAADGSAEGLLTGLLELGVGIRRFEHFEPSLHQIFVDRVQGASMPRSPRAGARPGEESTP